MFGVIFESKIPILVHEEKPLLRRDKWQSTARPTTIGILSMVSFITFHFSHIETMRGTRSECCLVGFVNVSITGRSGHKSHALLKPVFI